MWLLTIISLLLVGLGLLDSVNGKIWLIFFLVFASFFLKRRSLFVLGWVLVLMMCVFAQWGIAQFVIQQDLGLRLIGESILNSSLNGVAKFGNGVVRSYGPFEHANILGGLCLLALILAEKLLDRSKSDLLRLIVTGTLGLALFLTFSRAAIFGWLLLAIIAAISKSQRGQRQFMITLILLFTIVLWPLLGMRIADGRDAAGTERVRGYGWSISIIRANSIWYGIGLNNYRMELKDSLDDREIDYQPWEIDYVHSVPLLIIAQLGMVAGSLLIIGFIYLLSKYLHWGTLSLLGALIPIFLLDHYFITKPVALTYFITTLVIFISHETFRVKYV